MCEIYILTRYFGQMRLITLPAGMNVILSTQQARKILARSSEMYTYEEE